MGCAQRARARDVLSLPVLRVPAHDRANVVLFVQVDELLEIVGGVLERLRAHGWRSAEARSASMHRQQSLPSPRFQGLSERPGSQCKSGPPGLSPMLEACHQHAIDGNFDARL